MGPVETALQPLIVSGSLLAFVIVLMWVGMHYLVPLVVRWLWWGGDGARQVCWIAVSCWFAVWVRNEIAVVFLIMPRWF